MIRGALGSRYGISPLGRGVIRPASGGWWLSGGIAAANCIAAYQPKGAASYAASLVNLANPGTYDAFAGDAPTFDTSYGWLFNGVQDYLKTGIVPATNQTWSIIVSYYQTVLDYRAPLGVASTNELISIFPYYIAGRCYWYSGGKSFIIYTADYASGIVAIAGRNCYANGTLKGTMDAGTQVGNTQDFYIRANNVNGSPNQRFKGYIYSAAIYDTDISASIADLTTAMAAL